MRTHPLLAPGLGALLAAILVACGGGGGAAPVGPKPDDWPALQTGQGLVAASDTFAMLLPSRAKTFVVAGYDPDDRPSAPNRGNDDGFSGTNGTEAYRVMDQGNPLAVLAHFEGRAGVMGLFFRNFWSDSAGVPFYAREHNRTRIWLDGALAHDLPLTDFFRNPDDPRGQVAPFRGPFTGGRSGGHLTHAPLRWNDSFRIGSWDDTGNNAACFHRVAVTLATPEGELPLAEPAPWEALAARPGAWPHQTPRQPRLSRLQIPAGETREVLLAGPLTILELTCATGEHPDWNGLRAVFTWDDQPAPAVDLPLRLLGGMIAPPQRFAFEGLMFGNDGNRRIRTYLPMPFARSARLQFRNDNGKPVDLEVTIAAAAGAPPAPWGHFHATWHQGTTQTGVPFAGPRLSDARGMLRVLLLEDAMDTTGRIPNQLTTHLEGDLCVRINGHRGTDHTFDASETSIGRWGWYLTPADRPFVSDTSFQSGPLLRTLPGSHAEARRLMGSLYLFDPIHFVSGIDVVLEHGVQNDANADYGLAAMLYVEAGAARQPILELEVGNPAAEIAAGVSFTEWSNHVRTGNALRDQFYDTPAITETVRQVRDFYRFRVTRPDPARSTAPVAIGCRLDRLGGGALTFCQADVLVDGAPAGVLHCTTSNPVFPWVEGGEVEVEIPRALTEGKTAFTVELRPRAGTDPLLLARIWVYEYVK